MKSLDAYDSGMMFFVSRLGPRPMQLRWPCSLMLFCAVMLSPAACLILLCADLGASPCRRVCYHDASCATLWCRCQCHMSARAAMNSLRCMTVCTLLRSACFDLHV